MDTRDLSHRSTRDTRSRSPDAAHFDRKRNRSVEFSSKVVGAAQRPDDYDDDDSYYRRPQSRSGERKKSRSGSDERGRHRRNKERANDSSPEDLSFARQQAAVARGSYVAYVNYGTESGGEESSGEEERTSRRRQEQSTWRAAGRGGRQTAETSPEMDRKSRTSQTSPKIGLRGKASTKEPLASVGVKKYIHNYFFGKNPDLFSNIKGIVLLFEFGGVTRLIRSGIINWRPGKFFSFLMIKSHKRNINPFTAA